MFTTIDKAIIPGLISALVLVARSLGLFDMPEEAQVGLVAFLVWVIPNKTGEK